MRHTRRITNTFTNITLVAIIALLSYVTFVSSSDSSDIVLPSVVARGSSWWSTLLGGDDTAGHVDTRITTNDAIGCTGENYMASNGFGTCESVMTMTTTAGTEELTEPTVELTTNTEDDTTAEQQESNGNDSSNQVDSIDHWPTVSEFKSNFPRISKKSYPHLLPLDTAVNAHLNTSLTDLPGPLIPDSWTVETDIGELTINRVFSDPMVLTLPIFLNASECQEIIALGNSIGYKRSLTTSGVSNARTSESAYIPDGHPWKLLLGQRVSKLVGVPQDHIEFGPVLKYDVGQKFDQHHDSSLPQTFGRRLTFFVPLSSVEGEDGGHTGFPILGYKFPPLNGTAIIWRNYEPSAEHEDYDPRMKHAGEAPNKGIKYAVNMWIFNHPYVHYTRRPGYNASNDRSVTQSSASLPESQVPTRMAGGIPLLLALVEDASQPWLVQLDHGLVKVHPSFSTTQFLMVRIPDFVTLNERNQLITTANRKGWKESLVTSGISSGRTSASTWIYHTQTQATLIGRIAAFIGVPVDHVEATSMTRYRVGEYYHPHFDSQRYKIPDRLMTIHLVLQAEPDEEGGELYFPTLQQHRHRFRPIPGMAYIWRNYRPGEVDHDLDSRHGFDAPKVGTIYVMTAWVFPRSVRRAAANTTTTTTTPTITPTNNNNTQTTDANTRTP